MWSTISRHRTQISNSETAAVPAAGFILKHNALLRSHGLTLLVQGQHLFSNVTRTHLNSFLGPTLCGQDVGVARHSASSAVWQATCPQASLPARDTVRCLYYRERRRGEANFIPSALGRCPSTRTTMYSLFLGRCIMPCG